MHYGELSSPLQNKKVGTPTFIDVPTCLLELPAEALGLIIFGINLEIALGMCANGANLGSFFADADVTAVDALPDNVLVL